MAIHDIGVSLIYANPRERILKKFPARNMRMGSPINDSSPQGMIACGSRCLDRADRARRYPGGSGRDFTSTPSASEAVKCTPSMSDLTTAGRCDVTTCLIGSRSWKRLSDK